MVNKNWRLRNFWKLGLQPNVMTKNFFFTSTKIEYTYQIVAILHDKFQIINFTSIFFLVKIFNIYFFKDILFTESQPVLVLAKSILKKLSIASFRFIMCNLATRNILDIYSQSFSQPLILPCRTFLKPFIIVSNRYYVET